MSTAAIPRLFSRPASLVIWAVVLSCFAVLVGLAQHSGNQPDAAEPAVAPVLSAASRVPGARTHDRTRCESCGVVQSIVRFEPEGEQAASFEFTVRMRDGSTRVSSMRSPFSWRVGDNIILMGGDAPMP